eukprot:CFRG8174T1
MEGPNPSPNVPELCNSIANEKKILEMSISKIRKETAIACNTKPAAMFSYYMDVIPLPAMFLTGFSQNAIAGIVCLCCPGIFNALQGLGNGGGTDPGVSASMNAAFYGSFTVFGYFGGLVFNMIGTKIPMMFGGLCYCFYVFSIYLWNVDSKFAPVAITASGILGFGAALMWTAQGAMTLSYSTEDKKGQFTAIFWILFNFGGVIGGIITFFINDAGNQADGINAATYFTFCGIMLVGVVVAFVFVVHPSRVIKANGEMVKFEKSISPWNEIKSVCKLVTNKYMLLLSPLMLQSNWFYTYAFGAVNGNLFDAETRGLNSAIYWGMQMIGSYIVGILFLDTKMMGRRKRAMVGLLLVSTINMIQWSYAAWYRFVKGYDKGTQPNPLINYHDGTEYWVPACLYMCMGLSDAIVQTYAYWILGAIANSTAVLARYAGYYKGIQSFGACIAWLIEYAGALYKWQLVICMTWAVIFPAPTWIVATMVRDHGTEEDDETRDRSVIKCP